MGKRSVPKDPDDRSGLDALWRRRLATIRFVAVDPSRPRRGRRQRRRVWFRLCLEESWRTGQLVVELYQQKAQKSDEWGPLLPVALERENPEHFTDPQDRELLNLFRATAPTLETQIHLSGRHYRPHVSPWTSFLPPLLHASVLPRLAAVADQCGD